MSTPEPRVPHHLMSPRGLGRRRIFIPAFTLLCTAFLPVILFLGLYVGYCPVSGLILSLGSRLNRINIIVIIYVLFYISMFTGTGYVIHGIVMKIRRWPALRHPMLLLFLLLPIASSFARVLTYQSIQGGGGTYNFWEAVDRYYEKKQLRGMP